MSSSSLFYILLLLQRWPFKLDSIPSKLHEVTNIGVVAAARMFQVIIAVIVAEAGQGFFFIQII